MHFVGFFMVKYKYMCCVIIIIEKLLNQVYFAHNIFDYCPLKLKLKVTMFRLL